MRAASAFLTLLLLALVAPPALAVDEPDAGCTDTATVTWSTEFDAVFIVTGATVRVLGCDDGELVGLQLITDDGDVPEDDPLVEEVVDEHAFFDLSGFGIAVAPVTGVRVFLLAAPDVPVFFEISVDQRFFDMPGNEQVGLRTITVLNVAEGANYTVPVAPTGYKEEPCVDLGVEPGPGQIGEGSGTHVASASGVHVVCYQQVPGPPAVAPLVAPPLVIPPDVAPPDEPAILPFVLETRPTEVLERILAVTGLDVGQLIGVGLLAVLFGMLLVVRRARRLAR